MDAKKRAAFLAEQERLKNIPLELRDKSFEDAKVQAMQNICSACDMKGSLLARFQEAQMLGDDASLKQIQLEAQAWKRRETRLLAKLDKCETIEDMGKHLGSIGGKLEDIDLKIG